MTTAYPLTWPEHFKRSTRRERGAFKSTLASALKNVQKSTSLFAKDSGRPLGQVVISSNVSLGAERPLDPGVAVWFVWDGLPVCIAVDRYDTVASNLQAIHHILEARRTELRHGTLELVRASFAGFKSLPPPPGAKHWSDTLGIARSASKDEIESAYKAKAKIAHPDRGGSNETMIALTKARDQALRASGAN